MNPTKFVGLTMVLTGISNLDSVGETIWQDATAAYVRQFFIDNPGLGVSDVTALFQITRQNPPLQRNRRTMLRQEQHNRLLQSALELTYDQTFTYRADDSDGITPQYIVEQPFSSDLRRDDYVTALQRAGVPFAGLILVSSVGLPGELRKEDPSSGVNGDDRNNNDGTPWWIFLLIAVGAVLGLIILIGGFVFMKKRRNQERNKGYFLGGEEMTNHPISGNQRDRDDDISAMDNSKINTTLGGAGDPSIPGYGDQSVATVDYDYSKAYGGAADHSVSSAGGTFGSNLGSGTGNQINQDAYGGAALGSFDNNSFEEHSFPDPPPQGDGVANRAAGTAAAAANMREEVIDIYAPPGKLGVVIDTPDDGAPVVHAIKESSVIADKLRVGDKLVAVDDEDVRAMTAIKVSKLISRRSANATRKLSIVRQTLVG